MDNKAELYHITLDSGETIAIQHYLPDFSASGEMVVLVHEGYNKNFINPLIEDLCNKGIEVYILNLSLYKYATHETENYASDIINSCYESLISQRPEFLNAITFIACKAMALQLSAWVHDYAPQIKSFILFCPETCLAETNDRLQTAAEKAIAEYRLSKYRTDSPAIFTPLLLVISGQLNATDNAFYERLGSLKKKRVIINENDPQISLRFAQEMVNFLAKIRMQDYDYSFLLQADSTGYTWEENNKLKQPEKNLLRRTYWQLNKVILRIAGYFSAGIKIGLHRGFDSGEMLDYIYENQAGGNGWLNKRIDRAYLNSIPWQGARIRKKWVHQHTITAMRTLENEDKKINVLDIAAGHGRYLFELADSMVNRIDHILMRDYDNNNVEYVNSLIREKKLTHKITYEAGDAFSPEALTTLPRDRTLAIASGFYELFDDNAMVLASLKGIFNALEPGGLLVYTGIPWHPRHEYMARVMTRNRDGKLWVLRRRTQQELDQLIRQAGFIKIKQRMDPWGIYSVSLAKKRDTSNDDAQAAVSD